MGDAYTAPIVHIDEDGDSSYNYLHRDHIGSILAISDNSGKLIEKTHYGAWGTVKKYWDVKGNTNLGYESLLGRGYTGHEHFTSVSLLHMNGRMYDPQLRRFLSPDNFIQDPFSTQSFNRYGYVWNNPLKYNDPSGEELITALIIGAVIGALAGGTAAYASGAQGFWEWTGFILGGAAIGGVAALTGGAASAAIGKSLTVAGAGTIAGAAGGTIGGAIAGGGFAALSGENVGEGIWKGALSGFAGGGIGAYIGGGGGAFAGGFSSGSLGTALDGGNFGDIVKGGLISGALTFGASKIQQRVNFKQYQKTGGTFTSKQFRKISVASQRSFARGREFGGWILNNGDVEMWNKGAQKTIESTPRNDKIVAEFHTHPNKGGSYIEQHSPGDLRTTYDPSYVIGRDNTWFYKPDFLYNKSIPHIIHSSSIFNPYPYYFNQWFNLKF